MPVRARNHALPQYGFTAEFTFEPFTVLFDTSNDTQLEWLRHRVVCHNFQEDDRISPTGIPSHVYFAVYGFSGDGMLFPGGNQYSRYLKVLKKMLSGKLMQRVLVEFRLKEDDVGTHSGRKGSATYVSSCSTSDPLAAVICLRAKWTLPGVQDKDVRHEVAQNPISAKRGGRLQGR